MGEGAFVPERRGFRLRQFAPDGVAIAARVLAKTRDHVFEPGELGRIHGSEVRRCRVEALAVDPVRAYDVVAGEHEVNVAHLGQGLVADDVPAVDEILRGEENLCGPEQGAGHRAFDQDLVARRNDEVARLLASPEGSIPEPHGAEIRHRVHACPAHPAASDPQYLLRARIFRFDKVALRQAFDSPRALWRRKTRAGREADDPRRRSRGVAKDRIAEGPPNDPEETVRRRALSAEQKDRPGDLGKFEQQNAVLLPSAKQHKVALDRDLVEIVSVDRTHRWQSVAEETPDGLHSPCAHRSITGAMQPVSRPVDKHRRPGPGPRGADFESGQWRAPQTLDQGLRPGYYVAPALNAHSLLSTADLPQDAACPPFN